MHRNSQLGYIYSPLLEQRGEKEVVAILTLLHLEAYGINRQWPSKSILTAKEFVSLHSVCKALASTTNPLTRNILCCLQSSSLWSLALDQETMFNYSFGTLDCYEGRNHQKNHLIQIFEATLLTYLIDSKLKPFVLCNSILSYIRAMC